MRPILDEDDKAEKFLQQKRIDKFRETNPFSSLLLNVIDADKEKIDKLELLLKSQQLKFKKKRPCYYCWTFVGLTIGALFGFVSFNYYKFTHFSIYNRAGLDGLSKKYFGYSTWDKLLIGNLFTPSYDWNSKTPRFYGE